MKASDVPQDDISAFKGHLRKGLYAVDEEGNYSLQPSSGWSAEQVVLDQALNQFQQLADQAWHAARTGSASPLAYHMYCQRMDHRQLAYSAGKWQWQVKRHCKPAAFKRLGLNAKRAYAEALGITLAQLEQLPQRSDA